MEIATTFLDSRPSEARLSRAAKRFRDEPQLLAESQQMATEGYTSYMGIHPRRVGSDGGATDTVAALTTAMVDIDTTKHGVPPEQALKTLRTAPWGPPALINWTGGGYHAFWPYREPLEPSDPIDLNLHRRTCAVLKAYVGQDLSAFATNGQDCTDDCSAPTQNSRLPGTHNLKPARRLPDGSAPVVRTVHSTPTCFNPEDITEYAEVFGVGSLSNRVGRGPSVLSGRPVLKEVPQVLNAILEHLQLKVRVERGGHGIRRLRLQDCPACGSCDDCWLAPHTGSLHSFRQRGCPAGPPSGPIPLGDWIERYRPTAVDLVPEGPLYRDPLLDGLLRPRGKHGPVATSTPRPSSDDVHDQVLATTKKAMDWAEDIVGRCAVVAVSPPGAGKTTAVLEEVIRRQKTTGHGALLLFPSHAMAKEKLTQAKAIAKSAGVSSEVLVHVRGIKATCEHARGITGAYDQGYEVSEDWGLHRVACGFDGCDYHGLLGALSADQIKFAVHSHLDVMGDHDAVAGNLIIVDELPSVIKTVTVTRSDALQATAPKPKFKDWLAPLKDAANWLVALLDKITEWHEGEAARTGGLPFDQRWPLDQVMDAATTTESPENLSRVLAEASTVSPLGNPRLAGWKLRNNWVKESFFGLPRADLGLLFAAIACELDHDAPGSAGVVCVVLPGNAGGDVRIEWRRATPPPQDASFVLLDATALIAEPVVEAAMPEHEVKMFELTFPLPQADEGLHAFWLEHRSVTRSKMFDEDGALTEVGAGTVRNILTTVIAASRDILREEPVIALIGPKPLIEADLKGLLRDAGFEGKFVTAYHFNIRGTNALEDANLFINIGDPIRNIGASHEEARLLGINGGEYVSRIGAAEQIQTLHRSRAFRVTPATPKMVVHAGRMKMLDFASERLQIGPHRGRSAKSLAMLEVGEWLLKETGLTAHWLVLEVLMAHAEAPSSPTFPARAANLLRRSIDRDSLPTSETLRNSFREAFKDRGNLEAHPLRRLGKMGRPQRIWSASESVVEAAAADFPGWLHRVLFGPGS